MIVPVFLVIAVMAGVFDSARSKECARSKGCCTPDEWQGMQVSLSGFVAHHRPGSVRGSVYVYYDATNMRTAAVANYTYEGKSRSYRIVQRYEDEEEGKLYVVDLKRGKCFIKELERPFRKACIPGCAEESEVFTYGAGTNSLKARGYRTDVSSEKYKLDVMIAVTDQGCIPIGETVMGIARGVPLMESIGFVDIKGKIADPSVFDVPEQCESEFPGELLPLLRHEHSILAI